MATQKRIRDAGSGRYLSQEQAAKLPKDRWVTETDKKPSKKTKK